MNDGGIRLGQAAMAYGDPTTATIRSATRQFYEHELKKREFLRAGPGQALFGGKSRFVTASRVSYDVAHRSVSARSPSRKRQVRNR